MLEKFTDNNTIVNLSNSILRHFGVNTFHNTIPEIDDVLGDHKKVVVLLFDGLGKHIIDKHLRGDAWMRKHYVTTINATFPPTTVASTTGIRSAKYPIETGWLAWAVYLEEYNANISCFLNQRIRDKQIVQDLKYNIMSQVCSYTNVTDLIKSNGHTNAIEIMQYPCFKDGPKTLKKAKDRLDKFLYDNDDCYCYFYWTEPDDKMHEYGTNSFEVRYEIEKINKFVNKLCKDHPDTLFISLADHGQVNIEYLDICEHKDLYSLLRHECGLEIRTTAYYVQPGKESLFEELFNKYYGQYFNLLSQKEVLDMNLFGEGELHNRSIDFIGDFVSIAIDKYALYSSKDHDKMQFVIGHHAGYTVDEMEIAVSVYNK